MAKLTLKERFKKVSAGSGDAARASKLVYIWKVIK